MTAPASPPTDVPPTDPPPLGTAPAGVARRAVVPVASPFLLAPRAPRPLSGPHWPGPSGPAPGDVLAACAATGLVVAVALPAGPVGIGWPTAAAVAVAMVGVVRWNAGRRVRPDGDRSDHDVPRRGLAPADTAWTALAVALAAVPAVRAAEWFAALCLLAAVAAAALAVAGPSFPSLRTSLLAPAVAAFRAGAWVGRGLRRDGRPSVRRALGVVSASLAVLVVFVPLLASADAAFSRLVDGITPAADVDSAVRWAFLFGCGAAATAGACFLVLAPPDPCAREGRVTRLRCLDWALPTGLLVAILAVFVGVRFVVLFGSEAHIVRTLGMTYAEYARSGFWQLLVVTALALGVLAFNSRWAPVRTPADRVVKRGLLAALAVLTLVVVASALHRMWLYQQAYGFTVLRLLVLTCELWLGVGFLIALVSVLRLRPAGLTRPMVAAGMLALLGLAVLDPERFIAEHNVARWAQTGQLDTEYLSRLSVDAAPVLVDLPPGVRGCTLHHVVEDLREPDDWRGANLSRQAGRAALAGVDAACDHRYDNPS